MNKKWMMIGMVVLGAGLPMPACPAEGNPQESDRYCRIEPVESRIFDGMGYNPYTRTMILVFDNGSMYEFYQVPEEVVRRFSMSKTKGSFFNENIRHEYENQRIPRGVPAKERCKAKNKPADKPSQP